MNFAFKNGFLQDGPIAEMMGEGPLKQLHCPAFECFLIQRHVRLMRGPEDAFSG